MNRATKIKETEWLSTPVNSYPPQDRGIRTYINFFKMPGWLSLA